MDNTLTILPVRHSSSRSNQGLPEVEAPVETTLESTSKPFIQANTIDGTLSELKTQHLIPVYAKDNEPLISSAEFIEATQYLVKEAFSQETILNPCIRLSHPIKGRIPEAKNKLAHQLEEWEKTVYYERMAFIIEVPSISDTINGNRLNLTIGGIKAYNLDNLGNRKGSDEHFKIFIGFQNKVCLNMCVWSDGAMMDLKVTSVGQLKACIKSMIEHYTQNFHLNQLKDLCNYGLTEQQFAQMIGRTRMYQYLPGTMKKDIPPLLFGDTQIGSIVREYYKDDSFCKMDDGSLNLWRLYNLFTGVNKSTYIDQFLERGINAFSFVYNIKASLKSQSFNWYLN